MSHSEESFELSQQVKYPDCHVQLTGTDGNCFAIMGRVKRALQKAGASQAEVDQYLEESMASDYDALLVTATRWVSVS